MPERPPGLLLTPEFRRGFAVLSELGLSFDAFVFHPQLDELADLAGAFPETPIILDHCGGPVGIGRFAERRVEAFEEWRQSIGRMAKHPNVSIKLSGLGMRMAGFEFHEHPVPPSSENLALAWRPYIETCIETFGVERCFFASNFSPDKGTCSYPVLWNAFKRLCLSASADEREALFCRTAARLYRIDLSADP